MTDKESKRIYQYAKLGKAVMDVIHNSNDVCVRSLCTYDDYDGEDEICLECDWLKFCKLRQGVDK